MEAPMMNRHAPSSDKKDLTMPSSVHLDVDLEGGHDDQNGCDGVAYIQDIQHHRDHEVVHRGQRIRSPAVVHAAALGESRIGYKN